ncbi:MULTISPECIES: hypothetical protein [unclassified Coleofasciculus]|uniref:hypothetical protein n=1 Tax=Cyanophyceae TaxID=3028117 RepID=UPI001683A120|nr:MULTISPECIES: hypothetical protein [unclassified Coleofasciculus]MBD2084073.1 hypothetical protein [Coleofasciculus sp. FACHB-542]MBD2541179.1 hypothetical protein [Coleofasciculus sp. FACHB-SPT36]
MGLGIDLPQTRSLTSNLPHHQVADRYPYPRCAKLGWEIVRECLQSVETEERSLPLAKVTDSLPFSLWYSHTLG